MSRSSVQQVCVVIGLAVAVGTTWVGALTVTSDLYSGNRFPSYRTFAWVEGQPARHPDVETEIRDQAEKWLVDKGLTRVLTETEADLVISTHADRDDLFGIGLLRVTILDTETRRVVWAGQASDVASDDVQKIRKKIRKVFKQLFADFPEAK